MTEKHTPEWRIEGALIVGPDNKPICAVCDEDSIDIIAKSPLLPEAIEALKMLLMKFVNPVTANGIHEVQKVVDLIAKYEAKP